jgi:hypothetical protein
MRSLKQSMATMFVGVYISKCMFSAFFNLHRTKSKQMKKTTSMIFYIILLFIGHFTASCLHVILFSIFLENIKYGMHFWCLFSKNDILHDFFLKDNIVHKSCNYFGCYPNTIWETHTARGHHMYMWRYHLHLGVYCVVRSLNTSYSSGLHVCTV